MRAGERHLKDWRGQVRRRVRDQVVRGAIVVEWSGGMV